MPDFYGIDEEHQNNLFHALENEKLTKMETHSIVEEWLYSTNNIHTPLYKCSTCGESYYKMKVNFLSINLLSSLKIEGSKLEKYNKLSDQLKKSWNVFNFNRLSYKSTSNDIFGREDKISVENNNVQELPFNSNSEVYHFIYKFGFKVNKSELVNYYKTYLQIKYPEISYDKPKK